MNIDALKDYIDHLARHNLIFVRCEIEGLEYVDVGKELAEALAVQTDAGMLPLLADKKLDAILERHTQEMMGRGQYVAVRNLGILFEPELALNVHAKISEWSKEKALIVKLEGNVVDDEFHFCESDTSRCKIPLKNVACKII